MTTALTLKRGLAAAMAVAVAATTMVVFTQDTFAAGKNVTQENKNTGHKSKNKNESRIRKHNRKSVKNRARVRNRVRQNGNTGNNSSHKNTKGGSTDTGKVDADVTLKNTANKNAGDWMCGENGDLEVTVDQKNQNTGNRSRNRNIVKIKGGSKCKIVNSAKIKNSVSQNGNTGGNTSSKNTIGGDTDTGDVTLNVSITNNAN